MRLFILFTICILLTACSPGQESHPITNQPAVPQENQEPVVNEKPVIEDQAPVIEETNTPKETLDLHALPLGDGKFSTEPKKGFIFSCDTNFRTGGAENDGPWIQGTTYDQSQKVHVQGAVSWPQASISIVSSSSLRSITTKSLPTNQTTGLFPIQSTDPAYHYDRNPNSIQAQSITIQVPKNPTMTTPSCVGMGPIGYAMNGVAFYNGFDDGGRDAVAHEVQDECDGHPQQQGQYHYHSLSSCLEQDKQTLVGYAIDGFGIFNDKDEHGNTLTTADLDECHGTTSTIPWDGEQVEMYHYVATKDFPYLIGCFRGTPIKQSGQNRPPPPR